MESQAELLDALGETKTIALTTHRRDGRDVTTPVNVAIDDGHAYFRTWSSSGKAKRLRRDPRLEFANASYFGRTVSGRPRHARARRLGDGEAQRAAGALRRRFPVLHGVLVPLTHRLRHQTTVHYELEPEEDPGT